MARHLSLLKDGSSRFEWPQASASDTTIVRYRLEPFLPSSPTVRVFAIGRFHTWSILVVFIGATRQTERRQNILELKTEESGGKSVRRQFKRLDLESSGVRGRGAYRWKEKPMAQVLVVTAGMGLLV